MESDLSTPILVTCPHCQKNWQAEVYNFRWHEVNHRFWSDGFVEGEEWFLPSYSKRCPHCHHYFQTPKIDGSTLSEKPWPKSERLSFQEMKQAVIELADGEETEFKTRLEAWYVYNDYFRQDSELEIPAEDCEFNQTNMQWLLDYCSKKTPSPYSNIFELHRLLGHVEVYKELIYNLTYDRYIEWRNARNKEKGITSSLDEKQLRRLYNRFIEEKLNALDNPMKPYLLSVNN